MIRPRTLAVLAAAAAAAAAVLQHGRHATRGHNVAGGILIGDAAVYDTLSRLLLGPFVQRIAADVDDLRDIAGLVSAAPPEV